MYGCLVSLLEANDPAAVQLLPTRLLPVFLQVFAKDSTAMDETKAVVLRALKGLAASAAYQSALVASLAALADGEERQMIEMAIQS